MQGKRELCDDKKFKNKQDVLKDEFDQKSTN